MNKVIFKAVFGLAFLLGLTQMGIAQERIIEMTSEATYNPAELVVSSGDRITWTNKSNEVQTITVKTREDKQKMLAMAPEDAEPFSSGAIQPGESFSYTFYIPGTYEIVSLPNAHQNMSGRIIVKE